MTLKTSWEVASMFAISGLKKAKVYQVFYAKRRQEALAKQRALVGRLLTRKVGELPAA